MKFEIHIGKAGSGEWVWELTYEERRPYGSRPTRRTGVAPSLEEAKEGAEGEARSISKRHATQVNYAFEA